MEQSFCRKWQCHCLIWLLALTIQWLPALLVSAAEIPENQVQEAVQTWMRFETTDARPDAVVVSMEPWYSGGVVTAYIARLQGGGFCLCGADSRVLPVYFYSPEGDFDPELEDYQYILWEIGARKRYLESALRQTTGTAPMYVQRLEDRSAYWQQLISGNPAPRLEEDGDKAAPNTMILNLTSRWHQGSPYNDLCPNLTLGVDERVVVGCMATSTAQIMNYWQWPGTGVDSGSREYYYRWRTDWDETPLTVNPNPEWGDNWSWKNGRLEWTSSNGGRLRMTGYWDHSLYSLAGLINKNSTAFHTALETLWNRLSHQVSSPNSVNFGVSSYNWAIMPDTAMDPPGSGDLEVAKLCYHVGVAVEMNWGVWVSGSTTDAIVSALEDHFRYDHDALYTNRSVAASMIIEDIQWLRPVFIEGCREESVGGGCHSWVVVGYNLGIAPDHQFYINLGWGDGNEGWYTLDSMPFNVAQGQATHVAPTSVKFVGAADAGDGSPDDPYIDIDEAMAEAPDHSTLIFRAGSNNTFTGPSLVLDRPMTLKGYNVKI